MATFSLNSKEIEPGLCTLMANTDLALRCRHLLHRTQLHSVLKENIHFDILSTGN